MTVVSQYQKESRKSSRAIIFDVGGVLFLAKNRKAKKSLLTSYKELCKLLKNIDISNEELYTQSIETYMKSSRGIISKKTTLDILSKILHCSTKRVENMFKTAIKNNVVENKELIEAMQKLKGYKLGIISIQWPLSSDVLIPKKYYKVFDGLVISCFDKVRKPDPLAFTMALKKLNIKAENAIFVDDKEENLPPAKNLGMKTILFTNNRNFFRELKRLDVK